jgi:superfamily II DNA or RNA helicase
MQISEPGDLVRVRRQRWRVLAARALASCCEIALSGAGPGNLGIVRRILTPFDVVMPIAGPRRLKRAGTGEWRRACRQWIAESVPPGSLAAAPCARIDLRPHQLEPALAILAGAGCRALLADAVGLGKTIEAALIAAELQARGIARRTLILAPAGLRDQWAAELRDRFGIDAAVLDAAGLRRRAARLPVSTNPWTTVPIAVASVDYVKQGHVLPAVTSCRWDVLIVDEAHTVAGDTDRRTAVAELAGRTPYVLLLSATPHSGDRRQFHDLCQLGSHGDPILVFRRTRRDVPVGAPRRVHRLVVAIGTAERRMLTLLDAFGRAVRREPGGDQRERWLALAVLHKRALSSPYALQQSVERRLQTLGSDPRAPDAGQQLLLPWPDSHGELSIEDAAPPWPTALALGNRARERGLLERLAAAADRAAAAHSKVRALGRLLRRIEEPVIVFTEYRDTLDHLARDLDRPAALLHGGLTRIERNAVVAAFAGGHLPLLLATDAAAEGLNLQTRCRVVVNLELPWNPMRLEQRIGRVDRIGRPRTVHAFHLIARGTGEARLLEYLRSKIARARAEFDAADPLDGQDELSAARLVVAGLRPLPASERAEAPSTDDCVSMPQTPEAALEAARLAVARELLGRGRRPGAALCPTGPLLARARGRRLRTWLEGRVLLVFRASLDAAAGQRAACTLVPLLVEPGTSWPMSVAGTEAALASGGDLLRASVDAAARGWQAQAARFQSAFVATAMDRVRRIAQAAREKRNARSFQGELFSRRADREREQADAWSRELDLDLSDQLARLEASAVFRPRRHELLLVITP